MKVLFTFLLLLSGKLFAQNVGIGTSSPIGKLHVDGGSVIFTGDTGRANISGVGKRMMWMPGKAAFRVGGITDIVGGNEWNESNIGQYSFAGGSNTIASGEGSVAFGNVSSALGQHSFSFGVFNAASGQSSFSMGAYAGATGDYSMSMGHGASADGYSSRAFGQTVTTSADYGTTMGEEIEAAASHSLVIGRYNVISGTNDAWIASEPILVVGNGSYYNAQSNAFTLYKNGNLTIAGTLTQNSDATLKNDIEKVTGSLSKVMALSGYTYHWKNRVKMGTALHAGLLAQEVQAQMPELVVENESKELTVNYSGMIPYLVEAIKELKAENDALKQAVQQLKSK